MITINVDKAKGIAHEIRRSERAKEFAPLDVQATVPALAEQAEASRQAIREKYAAMQVGIDAAQTPDEIKATLAVQGLIPAA